MGRVPDGHNQELLWRKDGGKACAGACVVCTETVDGLDTPTPGGAESVNRRSVRRDDTSTVAAIDRAGWGAFERWAGIDGFVRMTRGHA